MTGVLPRGLPALAVLCVLAACTTSPTASANGSHTGATGTTASASPRVGATTRATPTRAATPVASPMSTTAAIGALRVRTVGTLPYPLSRMATATAAGQIVLLGGLRNAGSSGDVFAFDPTSHRVRRLGALEKAVHDTAAAALNGTVLVLGGGAATESSDVQALLASGATSRRGTLPQPRSDLSAVTIGKTVYVIGGYTGSVEVPDVLATTDGVHFRVVGKLPVTVRYAAVVAVGNVIWVIGGDHHFAPTSAVQRIDTVTGRITLVGHLGHPLGHASAWQATDGSVLIAGGTLTNTTRTDAVARLNTRSLSMTRVAQLPRPTSDMGVALLGGVAYLFGGETGTRITTIVSVG